MVSYDAKTSTYRRAGGGGLTTKVGSSPNPLEMGEMPNPYKKPRFISKIYKPIPLINRTSQDFDESMNIDD